MALKKIGLAITLIAAALVFVAGGCGDNDSGTQAAATSTLPAIPPPAQTTQACDLEAASIIPEPSGSPQHIYFYRDT